MQHPTGATSRSAPYSFRSVPATNIGARFAVGLVVTVVLVACTTGSSGTRVQLGDVAGIAWGDGDYGVVLVHDSGTDAAGWDAVALAMAEQGMTALAPDMADTGSVLAALAYLRDVRGMQRVALVAAGSGAAAALTVGRESPQLVDQLILISVPGDASSVTELGEFPKLFAASEGEAAAAAAEIMSGAAPGLWNALYLAPGSASGQAIFDSGGGDDLLDALLRRLDERR